MYLDAVLNRDYVPVFNGTEEATKAWIIDNLNRLSTDFRVSVGSTLEIFSIADYLKRNTL